MLLLLILCDSAGWRNVYRCGDVVGMAGCAYVMGKAVLWVVFVTVLPVLSVVVVVVVVLDTAVAAFDADANASAASLSDTIGLVGCGDVDLTGLLACTVVSV